MNSADRYILGRYRCFCNVKSPHHAQCLREMSEEGFCEITEFESESDKPFPEAICQVVLTAKGMEATGG